MSLAFLKANPGLMVSLVLLLMGLLVSLLFAWLMRQSGQSPRPVAFFLGFFLIVVLPQFAYHLSQVQRPAPAPAEPAVESAAPDPMWAHRDGRFLHPRRLFGPNVENELIRDARAIFPDLLGDALAAQMAMFPSGNTLLAARFDTPDQAARALRGYLALFRAGPLGGDLAQGVDVRRGSVGDLARIRLNGPLLRIWTAADSWTLADFAGGGVHAPAPASGAQADAAAAGSGFYLDPRLKQPGMWLFLALNLLAAVVFFFKGAAWASREPADAKAAIMGGAELAARLAAVNAEDVPMSVRTGVDGRELTVEWRFADARWLDLARAHRLRRSHRLVLSLDEASHTVRVKEYWRDLEAALGADGARAEWRQARGIQFFRYEHERVFGLQFDAEGRPRPELSYAYTFNLQELRQPFRQAVRDAGWNWQPVLLDAPPALRWLTE